MKKKEKERHESLNIHKFLTFTLVSMGIEACTMHTKIYGFFLHIHRELLRYQLIGFLQVNMQKQHSSSICSANWGLSDANFRFFFLYFTFILLMCFVPFCIFFFFAVLFMRFGNKEGGRYDTRTFEEAVWKIYKFNRINFSSKTLFHCLQKFFYFCIIIICIWRYERLLWWWW